ncbi:MAG: hypothetical protein LBN02_02465 [Oscillospiraceae bacterium]|jgi:hypothetical protein|nr:hypothetical protein [Oscillospiraceae bacterium]
MPRSAPTPPKKPANNRDAEGPAPRGSLAAPMLPRRYLDKRVETTLPRPFVLFRPWMILLSLILVFALNVILVDSYGGEMRSAEFAWIAASVVTVLYFSLFAYSVRVYSVYYKLSNRGAYIMSRRTIRSFGSMPMKLVVLGVVSLGVFIYLWLRYGKFFPAASFDQPYVDGYVGGLLFMSYAFLLENVILMRMRTDVLAVFTEDFWVSGQYKVRYDLVKQLRVVSRANQGMQLKGEKKVFFEAYDQDLQYLGRDLMNEGDYDNLEQIIRGRNPRNPDEPKEFKLPAQRRYSQPPKKKNPNKKK